VPGAELTLFKHGHSCVQLSVELPISNQETYTGDLLLEALDDRLTALTCQVELLTVQNEERTRSDQQQSQHLESLDKRLRKAVSGSLLAVALAIGTFSLSGALSAEQRGEWQKTLVQIVQVVATVAIGGWGVSLNRPEQGK
jgi:23S rRNA pseudoU1915 N3-methylase RlmH